MVAFRRGVPVTTTTPTVVVDAGLPLGERRFELVVTDAAGNASRPMQVSVTIARLTGPVGPVLAPARPAQTPPQTPPQPPPQTPPRRKRPDRSRP